MEFIVNLSMIGAIILAVLFLLCFAVIITIIGTIRELIQNRAKEARVNSYADESC